MQTPPLGAPENDRVSGKSKPDSTGGGLTFARHVPVVGLVPAKQLFSFARV